MEIKIKTKKLKQQIRMAINKKMKDVFLASEPLLQKNAEYLRDTFKSSSEFGDLKGKLVGQFGFTPEEVAQLDRILDLLVPGSNKVTVTRTKYGQDEYSIALEWVDMSQLKAHPFAQHDLTTLDETGSVTGVTDTVSWVEWLEEGVSVIGYYFSKVPASSKSRSVANRSRSGAGLMKKSQGGVWTFQPTRVFEGIAKMENGKFLKKGFKLIAKKINTGR